MPIHIKPAEAGDIPFILNSVAEVNRKSGLTKPAYLTEETLKQDVFDGDAATSIIIAMDNNTPVGFSMFSPIYFTLVGHAVWVTQLFTHKDYRRQGIASMMLDYIKNTNTKANALCWITTQDNPDAQSIFNKITTSKNDNVAFYVMKTI